MGNPEGQCECKGRAVVALLLPRSNCRCQENRRRGRSLHWSIWTVVVLGLLLLTIGRASASDPGERASSYSCCNAVLPAISCFVLSPSHVKSCGIKAVLYMF